jgi:undecaprenyl-diphosphatase
MIPHELIIALVKIDKFLFHKINSDWGNPLFDIVMPFITNFKNTQIFILLILVAWIFKQKKFALKVILGAIIAVGCADLIADRLIKPLVHRGRPEFSTTNVILRAPHQGSPSFPSSHAANSFAAAGFLGLLIPLKRKWFWLVAGLIGYSRIYCGVHYPIDVLAGALLGMISALTVYQIWGYRIHAQAPVWREPVDKIPRYRRNRQA